MANSLIKFANRGMADADGEPLHWGRLEEDGLPFRGQAPTMAREGELEERLARVGDSHNATFDLSDKAQNHAYLAVLDKIVNGLAQLLFRKPSFFRNRKTQTVKTLVYIEWVEFYMEEAKGPRMDPHA